MSERHLIQPDCTSLSVPVLTCHPLVNFNTCIIIYSVGQLGQNDQLYNVMNQIHWTAVWNAESGALSDCLFAEIVSHRCHKKMVFPRYAFSCVWPALMAQPRQAHKLCRTLSSYFFSLKYAGKQKQSHLFTSKLTLSTTMMLLPSSYNLGHQTHWQTTKHISA